MSQRKHNQERDMNQVTIYGDIHANLPALEAVFTDMDAVSPISSAICPSSSWPRYVLTAINLFDILLPMDTPSTATVELEEPARNADCCAEALPVRLSAEAA